VYEPRSAESLGGPLTALRARRPLVNRPVRPQGSAGHLVPFIGVLDACGAPWRKSLARAGLRTEYEDPTERIDAERGLRFVQHMSYTQGMPCIGFEASQRDPAPVLHPRLRRTLSECDTLLQALRAFSELSHLQGSHLRIWLKATPGELQICHTGSVSITMPGADQLEVFRTVRLIEVVRNFLGRDWKPTRLWLTQDRPGSWALESWLDGPEIQTGRAYGAIGVSRPALTAGVLNPLAGAASSAYGSYEDLIEGIVQTNLCFGTPTLDQVAAQIGISSSTLKRGLARRGTNYSKLLDRVRFRAARRLLTETNLALRDVACEVGYTDAGNFSRAFRRISGLNPGELRPSRPA